MKQLIKIALILFFFTSHSQTNLDSLYKVWNNKNESDTNRLDAINKYIWSGYLFSQPDSAFYYTQLQYSFAKNKNLKKHQAIALNTFGIYFYRKGNLVKAIENYAEGLKLREEIIDKKGVASSLSNIAMVYSDQRDFKKALEYNQKSLKIREELGDKKGISISLSNIGGLYNDQGDNTNAFNYFNKGLSIDKEINNRDGESTSLYNIGNVKKNAGEYDLAIEYFNKSLKIKEELGNKFGVAKSLISIGHIYYFQKQFNKSIHFAKKALTLSGEIESADQTRNSAGLLYKNYKAVGNQKLALEMYELYINMRDSIESEVNHKEIINQKYKYEYEKQAATDSVSASKEIEIKNSQLEKKETEIKSKRNQQYFLFTGLFLVIVFAGFMFNRFKVTQKQKQIITLQKHLVDEKHKEITDSINYAERIQRSFLASKDLLDSNLKDYFVFFKPKDVVSGDFYWASRLNNGNFALVTADSTGHGVPGAIMSLLNITSLEKAIETLIQPSDILNSTRKTIIERLKKDGSEYGGKDGMDASLTVYDFKNNKLLIAAANNPVWIVRGTETIEIKADKMPVGKHDRDAVSFIQQEIELQKGDVVYTLTDGFPDQFGGAKGKKFMSKNLRELLSVNIHLPMPEQKILLEKTFSDWVGDLEQVDDVTIIGVRI
jgi:serine phosphatase RsbU (regulator of sigma subunit)